MRSAERRRAAPPAPPPSSSAPVMRRGRKSSAVAPPLPSLPTPPVGPGLPAGPTEGGEKITPKEAFRLRRVARISTDPPWMLSYAAYKEQQARIRFEKWAKTGEKPKDRVRAFRQYLKVHGIVPSERYRSWMEAGTIPRGQVPDFEKWVQSKRIDPRRLKLDYDSMESRMKDPEWRTPQGHEYPGDRRRWFKAIEEAKERHEFIPPRVLDEYARLKSFEKGMRA